MSENLIQYGTSFQSKIITSLLLDSKFTKQIIEILEVSYFDTDSNKYLIKSIKEYFVKYKTPPTMEAVKVIMEEVDNPTLKTTIVDSLRNAWNHREATDLPFVQEKTLEFCKNQVVKGAIMQSVELLESHRYDEIKGIIDKAMTAGMERDIGHEYITGFEERMSQQARIVMPTAWDSVNDLMDGGLGGGELGVIVAPAGIGKSWTLQAIGAHAVKQGKTVIHYTLELNAQYVGLRYDTIVSGQPTGNLQYYKEEVQKAIDKLKGNLIIKYWPTRTASVNSIVAHLQQCELQGIKPDMVIVDYADIMKSTSNFTEKRHQIGHVYEELRGMAGEFEIPVWTASQANRSALEEDVIDASKVSEDYSKVMTSDFVMSMSRKVEDKIANTGRFHVIKNRFGPDGITFPATINTNTGFIQIYETSSQGGKAAQGKMNNADEYLRKTLAQKKKDFDGEGFE
jgi:replicative DNA helicase|tara:strand:- start:1354 stop:2715 length:1362 start_codon:yes stop_codon:yes gene_type:complete